jgi:type II secretory pathway pseudopilin PulG
MALLAPTKLDKCPRCGKPIPRGAPIERYDTDANKRPRYAHKACQPLNAAQQAAAALQAARQGRPQAADEAPNQVLEDLGNMLDEAGWDTEQVYTPEAHASGPEVGTDEMPESGQDDDGDDGGDGEGGTQSVVVQASGGEDEAEGEGPGEAAGGSAGDEGEGEAAGAGAGEGAGEESEVESPKPIPKPKPAPQAQPAQPQAPAKPKPDPAQPQAQQPQAPAKPKPDPQQFIQDVARAAADMAVDAISPRVATTVASAINAVMPRFEAAVGRQIEGQVAQQVQQAVDQAAGTMQEAVQELTQQAAAELRKTLESLQQMKPVVHHVIVNDQQTEFPPDEVFHKAFDEVLKLAANGFNVFLPGPTGCGKTHLARQVARALGLEFGIISGSAGTTEAEILGRSIPNVTTGENVYVESDFVRLYENGGLFLLDEGDAMDPNCLLKANAAIANGFCPVPARFGRPIAKRHEKFVFLMAANTWGQGATRLYCGRNKLDEATLDRFRAATVPMDYDEGVEVRYACPDLELYGLMKEWRAKIVENGFQRVLSTRFMRDAYILNSRLGYDTDAIARKLTGGWSKKEVVAVIGKELDVESDAAA